MKTKVILLAGLAAGLALQISAVADPITLTQSTSPGAIIPDNDLNGVASTMDIDSVPAQEMRSITGVTLTVDVTGDPVAWNGDYYAYLSFGPDLCLLLDNVGTGPYGSPGDGFDITFSDAVGVPNVSTAAGLNTMANLTGTYAPQVGNLSMFNSLASPVGDWTLFIADTDAGDVGQLASWSLTINGTPDNSGTLLLLAMGVGFLGLFGLRRSRHERVSNKRQ